MAFASPASAVSQASAEAQFSAAGIGWTSSGVRSDGAPMYEAASGNVYADEGNRWDVTFYTCGC